MCEGGCISRAFHFKMVKNYVIFVLTADVVLGMLGMLLDWLVQKSVTSKNRRSLQCCFESLSPLHFPNILPTLFRPLLFIWGFVLLTDKNETHTGHEAG